MICGGCQRKLEPGDLFIEDAPCGYIGEDSLGADLDALLVDLMTHNDELDGRSDRLVFCEGCTYKTREGRYHLKPYAP